MKEGNIENMFCCFIRGHLEQLMMLHPMMKDHDSFILTEKTNYQFNSKGIKSYDVIQINRRNSPSF